MQKRIGESVSKTRLLVGLIVIVCVVVLVVHWSVLSARSFSIDDDQYLVGNVLVQSPSLRSAKHFLTEVLEPSTVGGYYQPLSMISLMVDYAMGGRLDNLMTFHRTSLALHMANTALVIVLLYLIFGNVWAAAGMGLLFGVHPMTVETIAWVSERKTLVATFFALWCLIFYVRFACKKKWWFYLGCMAMYILALMSKPTSTPLPMMMLLMDYWPLKRLKWRTVLEKIPFFVVGAISAVITYISQSRTAFIGLPAEFGPERIPLIICHDIIFYPYKIFWPVGLSSYYPFPSPLSLTEPRVAAGVIGTCILIPLLIFSLRWTRAALTGWLIFFIGILPTMQIIGFSNVIASDKFAYLPSIGLLMVLASLVSWCWHRGKAREPKGIFSRLGALKIGPVIVVLVVLVLAGAGAVATQQYLGHWRSTLSLSQYMLERTPGEPQVINLLGYAFQTEGRLEESIKQYRKALEIAPDFVDARNNIAIVLKLQGRYAEAAVHYKVALQNEPTNANIHYNLANVLELQGNYDEAISHYHQALEIRPRHINALNNLANLLASQGKFDEAIGYYHQILKIKPNDWIAYNNLGATLEEQGKFDEAIAHYSMALRIKPDFSEAHYNMVYAFASQGKLDEGFRHYRQVLGIELTDAELYNSFGVALVSKGMFDEAIGLFSRAIQAWPDYADAHCNLGFALASQGKYDEAFIYYRKALQFKPDNVEIHLKVGNLLASQNILDEAIGHFSRALRLAPNNSDALYSMGMALAMTNKPREAIIYLKQAMQLRPSWYEPAIWMARILATYPDIEVRDPNKAVIIAMHAAELTQYQDPVVLETLAASYAATGQYEMAVRTAQEALALANVTQEQDNELVSRLRDMVERYKQATR